MHPMSLVKEAFNDFQLGTILPMCKSQELLVVNGMMREALAYKSTADFRRMNPAVSSAAAG